MRSGRYLHVSVHHLLISSIDSVPIARPRLLFYVGIFTVHTNRVHRVQSYIVCLTLSNSPFCQAVRLLKVISIVIRILFIILPVRNSAHDISPLLPQE